MTILEESFQDDTEVKIKRQEADKKVTETTHVPMVLLSVQNPKCDVEGFHDVIGIPWNKNKSFTVSQESFRPDISTNDAKFTWWFWVAKAVS